MSRIASLQHDCGASIQDAIQKLQEVKVIMVEYEADTQKLQQDMSSLRLEKQTLLKEIVDMKQQLRDLGEDLTETQNRVLTHVYTTPGRSAADMNLADDDESCFPPETTTEVTGTTPSQASQFGCRPRELDFSLDCMSVISSSSSEGSVPKKRPRRSSKWNKSPKKWRRMMRSNRLQSILLLD